MPSEIECWGSAEDMSGLACVAGVRPRLLSHARGGAQGKIMMATSCLLMVEDHEDEGAAV
jgi:hypothetical protein